MVENIDDNVGRILKLLELENLTEDTIVVYFNDNGPNSFRWNGGLKGKKGSVDEGGVRSPCLIQWPQKIPAGLRSQQLSGAIDLTPTLCALAGIEIDTNVLDGLDLSSQLLKRNEPVIARKLYSQWAGQLAVRSDAYMLDANNRLFDLIKDPTQQEVLNEQFPDLVEQLKKEKEAWKRDVLAVAKIDSRPFTVGDRRIDRTELPARDAVAKGPTIKRSAAAPNCSYFTSWKSLEDQVSWNIEVLESGDYEILLQYNAPASSVGSVIEIQYGELVLQAEIKETFLVEPYGAEKDRVKRQGESLMKTFPTMSCGRWSLKPSQGNCSLKLIKITGNEGLEIQGIEFIRTL
jgi:hypothetical protein